MSDAPVCSKCGAVKVQYKHNVGNRTRPTWYCRPCKKVKSGKKRKKRKPAPAYVRDMNTSPGALEYQPPARLRAAIMDAIEHWGAGGESAPDAIIGRAIFGEEYDRFTKCWHRLQPGLASYLSDEIRRREQSEEAA